MRVWTDSILMRHPAVMKICNGGMEGFKPTFFNLLFSDLFSTL